MRYLRRQQRLQLIPAAVRLVVPNSGFSSVWSFPNLVQPLCALTLGQTIAWTENPTGETRKVQNTPGVLDAKKTTRELGLTCNLEVFNFSTKDFMMP